MPIEMIGLPCARQNLEVRASEHSPARVGDLADESDLREPDECRQVDRRFSVAPTRSDATGVRAEWEQVTGADVIARRRGRVRKEPGLGVHDPPRTSRS